ncbi:pilus assembly protein PilZ [Bradyrhizobium lablabi]|uniref:Pilus assembly protein PilZ n=1 Tax=Bradyrhizobium lablabi TaxID=722472 RepID=A0A0R3MK81_9BRAD|nr:PilZ domain-containing protein [Bradyrhizobium lablabi]KRR20665.1 pilus assembly protein PilZ [Bradyrhizobium lablabi]
MLERRRHPRGRVYYGGMIAFNARNSTLDCIVRNFSRGGAKIEFENSAILPDQIDFEVVRRGLSCHARPVWRDHNTAGLMFCGEHDMSSVIPLEWARKLRASERSNRRLKSRLNQLLNEF